jgi:hypothetical protein
MVVGKVHANGNGSPALFDRLPKVRLGKAKGERKPHQSNSKYLIFGSGGRLNTSPAPDDPSFVFLAMDCRHFRMLILSNGKFSSITFLCNRRAVALCLRANEHHDHDEEGKDGIYPVQGDIMGRLLLHLFLSYRFHFRRVGLSNVEVVAWGHWEGGTEEF